MFRLIHTGRVIAVAAAVLATSGAVTHAAGTTVPCETEASATTAAVETTEAAPGPAVIDPGDDGNYSPSLDPATFVDQVDNPYMPLAPGSRWVYESGDGSERTEVEVLDERKDIMGISATVVRDTVFIDEIIAEDTYDWFAQDADGNVWYLGEATQDFDECGQPTDTGGSFEYGVDGALPGIAMPANPEVGFAYRQEFYAGEAEDLGEVIEVGVTRSIELGDYDDVVVTRDWNPLDPEVIEEKSYAPGVGMIFEEHVRGGDETTELVEFTPGG